MRTIEFNNKDIKECKLALVNQSLTSLQSAFLMQHITNLEQALNEIEEIVQKYDFDKFVYTKTNLKEAKNNILQIIDKVGGNE